MNYLKKDKEYNVYKFRKGIYNASLKEATNLKIIKKWNNVYFVQIYVAKLKTVYINIKDKELKEKILSKEIKAQDIHL